MLAPWPKPFADSARERLGATPAMAALVQGKFAMLSGGRNVRANYKIAQSTKISAIIVPTDDQYRQLIVDDSVSFSALLNAEIKIIDASEWQSMSSTSPATSAVVSDAGTMYIPLAGLIDSVAEVAKLKKQKEAIIKARDGYKNNLAKDSFVANAPPAVVEMTKIKLADSEAMLVRVNEQIKALE